MILDTLKGHDMMTLKERAALVAKYPLELRTTTKSGSPVVVRYRRIPVRKHFDVEAVILSGDNARDFAPDVDSTHEGDTRCQAD